MQLSLKGPKPDCRPQGGTRGCRKAGRGVSHTGSAALLLTEAKPDARAVCQICLFNSSSLINHIMILRDSLASLTPCGLSPSLSPGHRGRGGLPGVRGMGAEPTAGPLSRGRGRQENSGNVGNRCCGEDALTKKTVQGR